MHIYIYIHNAFVKILFIVRNKRNNNIIYMSNVYNMYTILYIINNNYNITYINIVDIYIYIMCVYNIKYI